MHQHIVRRKARFDRVDVEIANQRREETFSLGAIRVKTGADASTDRCGGLQQRRRFGLTNVHFANERKMRKTSPDDTHKPILQLK